MVGTCIAIAADVSTVAGAQALADAYLALEPQIGILVDNTGNARGADVGTLPESGWDKVVNLNMKAPFFLTQILTPALMPWSPLAYGLLTGKYDRALVQADALRAGGLPRDAAKLG